MYNIHNASYFHDLSVTKQRLILPIWLWIGTKTNVSSPHQMIRCLFQSHIFWTLQGKPFDVLRYYGIQLMFSEVSPFQWSMVSRYNAVTFLYNIHNEFLWLVSTIYISYDDMIWRNMTFDVIWRDLWHNMIGHDVILHYAIWRHDMISHNITKKDTISFSRQCIFKISECTYIYTIYIKNNLLSLLQWSKI